MKTYVLAQYLSVAAEGIAFIAGMVCWKKFRHNYWKWFVLYLGAISIFDFTGICILYIVKDAALSRTFYNYFVIPLEFIFFYWLYFRYFKGTNYTKWPLAGAAIYMAGWLVNILFLRQLNFWALPFSYMTGIIALLIIIIAFYYKFISGNDILNFKTEMMFWVSLGLLLFYLVSSPFFGLRLMLYKEHRNVFWIYYYMQFGVNYLMYFFFTIALLWGKPR